MLPLKVSLSWWLWFYAPNPVSERRSFFRRLEPFLNDPKRIVLVDDWNTIIDPKIDKVGKGDRGLDWCESCLIDLIGCPDLVDRFCLDTQRGRCGYGLIVRPLFVLDLTWTEC